MYEFSANTIQYLQNYVYGWSTDRDYSQFEELVVNL